MNSGETIPIVEGSNMSQTKHIEVDQDFIENLCDEFGNREGTVVQILQRIQEKYGYVPADALDMIGEYLEIPKSKMYGVLTFYSQFYREPRGKYVLKICVGTACHVRGAGLLVDKVKEELKIEPGENTEDMLFTLEPVSCLGSCALAPMAMVTDTAYGKLSPDKMLGLIKDLESEHLSASEPA
jgi:NADH-quinone oxidoreductase subunit E